MKALQEFISEKSEIAEHKMPVLEVASRDPVKRGSSERAGLIDKPRLRQRSARADVNNAKGETRVDLLSKQRNGELSQKHVGYRRDARATECRGNSPLHLLLSCQWLVNDDELANLARIRLQSGADVEAKDDNGKTLLHAAVSQGSLQVTELLLQYGADARSCDNQGLGVLHYLAISPINAAVCAELLQLLLNAGCDVNATSQHGRTPLYVAVCAGHNVCFDLLIEHGANVKCRDLKYDTTILHIAAKCAKEYVIQRLMQILRERDPCEKDAMINAKQKDGRTALHLATRHKLTSSLNLLLQNGADVESRDLYGQNALHYACRYNNVDVFDQLMDFGADIGAEDNKGMTPMKLNDDVKPVIWLRVVTRNAKSMAVGLPVIDFRQNLNQIMHEMKTYEKYNSQVDQMKQTMINSRVSVYDLLLDEEKMYKYKNNIVLKEIIIFCKMFPSYREMLIGKYRRACMRRYFVRLASRALSKMTGYRLENELSDMIFAKLSNSELHDFIKAAVRD